MKITATRREEIEKLRKEYDDETQSWKDKQDALEDEYHDKLANQQKDLEDKVSALIGSTSLDLEIRANPYGSFTSKGWSVAIRANERKKFDGGVALSWSWDIKLDGEGNIQKDSGSWSGLKAITAEQLADLEESVRILKVLNNIDWNEILNSPKAKYEDFVNNDIWETVRDRNKNRPDFESDILSAELEDLVGTHTAVQLSDDMYWRGNVWMFVTGLTDKFVKGYIFPQYYLTNKMTADMIINQVGEERRVSRNKIVKDSKDKLSTIFVE